MEHLKMHTINKVDENVSKIAALFPNCVTEAKGENGEITHKIDFDMLKQELSNTLVEGREERYQFTWPDKKQAILTANAPINKTLRPCREESVNFDETENLYIEGDNLEVLKLLQETYLGKIKMIYIDPPYNTGNDFVYNDDFSQDADDYMSNSGQTDEDGNRLVANTESNGRFHTDWLNMMYPRLKLARDLLSDDGVIFISIDENEITNIKYLCNEIFGEENLVTVIHCQMSTTQGMKVKAAQMGNIVKNAEYILVYSRDGHKNIAKETPLYDLRPEYDEHYTLYLKKDGTIGQLTELYDYKFPKDCANKKPMKLAEAFRKSEEFADIVRSHLADIVRSDKVTGFDVTQELKNGYWKEVERNGKKYLLTLDAKGSVRQLLRLCDSWGKCDDYYRSEGLRKIRGDWWANFYIDMGNVSKEGDMEFPNGKKPVRLLNQLTKMCCSKDSIVLDFFSGSATTAHAVMQLNAEDGGNRKFIMVQLPEPCDEKSEAFKSGYKNICEIGKERIRRAGQQILKTCQKDKEKSHGLDFANAKSDENLLFNETPLGVSNPCDNIGGVAGVSPAEGVAENAQAVGARGRLPPSDIKLDIGFRVLKCDTSNMEDVYYTPDHFDKNDLFKSNIKTDRTPEDLLFQVMLDLGIMLSSKIQTKQIDGKTVYYVEGKYLVACFDEDVTEETITKIAKEKPYYFVMKDSSMANDSVATNFEQIFTTYSPETIRKVL